MQEPTLNSEIELPESPDDILERTLESIIFEEQGSYTRSLIERLAKYIIKSNREYYALGKEELTKAEARARQEAVTTTLERISVIIGKNEKTSDFNTGNGVSKGLNTIKLEGVTKTFVYTRNNLRKEQRQGLSTLKQELLGEALSSSSKEGE